MLPLEFFLTDAHFAIGLLAALACFAIFWLYFDAWLNDRALKDFLKWLGYGVLAVGFLVTAIEIEPSFVGATVFGQIGLVALVLRGIGYAVLAAGLALDPLQPIPKIKPLEPDLPVATSGAPGQIVQPAVSPQKPALAGMAWVPVGLRSILPVLAGVAALLYWRRATKGLERHLMPVARAFVWFTLFELADLAVMARATDDPRIYALVAPFGPLWIAGHILLLLAAVGLGRWGWRYLTKRLQTQLFMVLTTACLVIFLVTTVSFTFLLMSRVQDQAFASLETTSKVLQTTIAAQQTATVADAEVVAQNPAILAAVVAHDHSRLVALTADFLAKKHRSSLVITTESGQVLLRAEDPASWGDSLSSDSVVARAAVGKATSGLVAATGALAPRIAMRATTPMRNTSGLIVGTVAVGFTVDNAFVDGLKQTTGLAASIYSGRTRVASTLVSADGRTRSVGVLETNQAVLGRVLTDNKPWSGLVTTASRSFLAVYAPLRDADNAPVGMLFIGQPQVLLLQAAGRSIELTFMIAVLLLIVAIVPVHLISRSIARQLH